MWCKVKCGRQRGKQNSLLAMFHAAPLQHQLTTSSPRPFFPASTPAFTHTLTQPTLHTSKIGKMSAADDDDMVVDQQGQGQEDGEEAPRSGMCMCTMIGWAGGWAGHKDTFDRRGLSTSQWHAFKPLDVALSRRR